MGESAVPTGSPGSEGPGSPWPQAFKVQAYCPQPGPCHVAAAEEPGEGAQAHWPHACFHKFTSSLESQVKNAMLTTWSETSTREFHGY